MVDLIGNRPFSHLSRLFTHQTGCHVSVEHQKMPFLLPLCEFNSCVQFLTNPDIPHLCLHFEPAALLQLFMVLLTFSLSTKAENMWLCFVVVNRLMGFSLCHRHTFACLLFAWFRCPSPQMYLASCPLSESGKLGQPVNIHLQ